MSNYCHKHKMSDRDERWQEAFQELVAGEEEHIEPFEGCVCPLCFLALREKYRKARRQLRAESRSAIRSRTEHGRLQTTLDAVVDIVKQLTGKNAYDMVGVVFERPCFRKGTPQGTVGEEELGKLERILPNLIVEAIQKGRNGKVQNPDEPEQ